MTAPFSDGPNMVPLSRDRHGACYWQPPPDYAFVRNRASVPVVGAEVEIAATAFPVVFADTPGTDCPRPVALLRLQAETSPFVTTEGRWLAPYIPAILRVYPFTARGRAQDTRLELIVDEGSGLITEIGGGRRFFEADGSTSAALDSVVKFFKAYERSARDTLAVCQVLAQMRDISGRGLFKPLVFNDFRPEGVQVLDRSIFDALDDGRVLALRHAGALPLVMAHFISCHQLSWLSRAETATSRSDYGDMRREMKGAQVASASSDISDFLEAISLARIHDDLSDEHGSDPQPRQKPGS